MARRARDNQTAALWVEQGETRTAPLITVAPTAPVDGMFTFTADPVTASQIRPGQRVLVPFGKAGRTAKAIVVSVDTGPWTSTLKSVLRIIDPAGELNDELLSLGKWIARYYCCPLGRTLAAMIPQAARRQSGFTTVRRAVLAVAPDELAQARPGPKQRMLIESLRRGGGPVEVSALLAESGASRATLRTLIDKGWVVETTTKEAPPLATEHIPREEPRFELNADQRGALERVSAAIDAARFRALLLYGVSGSGKTEVYVHAMRRVVASGHQAILLVPEIALTTQLMHRLAARFDRLALVHSGLSDVQRSLAWEQIHTGRASVVIGTRSAVFAPCPSPGIIVVDEEQETSFKNLQSPRFHVRDVAIKRASILDIPVLLGSATPSLETWLNHLTLPTYERINLPHRVRELPMPAVRLLETGRAEGAEGGLSLSGPLREEIAAALERGEQSVVLLNRRGFATWLYCPACRRSISCPNCNSNMVLHVARNRLMCHHCRAIRPVPAHCPDVSCRKKLVRGGGGTQRVEEQLRTAFPSARIRRADSDTMLHARQYRALVREFEAGELDIIVGTQMIAKGLDFPNVSLVGVVGADMSSGATDFRCGERLFQLVTQVAGRAGRGDVPGKVIVQSGSTDLPALRFAINHDFEGFAAAELRKRKAMDLPPYTRMTRFVLSGKRDTQIASASAALADRLRDAASRSGVAGPVVLGPFPCAIERIRGQYRYELLLQAPSASKMLTVLDAARHNQLLKSGAGTLIIDVDPVSLT